MQPCLTLTSSKIGNLGWNQQGVRQGSRPHAPHPTGQIRGASRSLRRTNYKLGPSRDLTVDRTKDSLFAPTIKRHYQSRGISQARATATLSVSSSPDTSRYVWTTSLNCNVISILFIIDLLTFRNICCILCDIKCIITNQLYSLSFATIELLLYCSLILISEASAYARTRSIWPGLKLMPECCPQYLRMGTDGKKDKPQRKNVRKVIIENI